MMRGQTRDAVRDYSLRSLKSGGGDSKDPWGTLQNDSQVSGFRVQGTE